MPSNSRTSRLGYLDGIRGWAALSVVVFHTYWELLRNLRPAAHETRILLVNDGNFAVLIFFVLSGFVLSTGYLRAGQMDLVRHLALRRYPRLTIPIMVVTALALVLSETGLLHNHAVGTFSYESQWMAGQFPNAHFSVSAAKYILYRVYFIGEPEPYGGQLWTMAWEMQGSFLVFGLLLMIRLGKMDRFVWYAMGLALFLNLDSLFACFIFGVILADMDASGLFDKLAERSRFVSAIGFCLALAVGLYRLFFGLSGGYGGILNMTAAALLIAGIVMCPSLRRLFQSRMSRYLGAISFPLYLSHMAVLCSLGSWLALTMHGSAYSDGMIFSVVLAVCVAVSLAAATLLLPIENLAIAAGHHVSSSVLSDGLLSRQHGPRKRETAPRSAS